MATEPQRHARVFTSKLGTTSEAMRKLMRQSSPFGERDFTLLALLVGVYCSLAAFSRVHTYSLAKLLGKLLWKNATARPPVLLILILVGWSWVVKTCTAAGMELERVLGGPTKPHEMATTCAITLLNVFLGVHLIHFVASEIPGLTWRPWLTSNVLLHLIFMLVGLLPHRYLHAEPRSSLVRTLWESLIAPLGPVTFWHVIVADYATSLAKAFADLQKMFCVTSSILAVHDSRPERYVRTTVLWDEFHGPCVDALSNSLMLALPFWCRLFQCLRVYSETREQKNLWYAWACPTPASAARRTTHPSIRPRNALKYSSAFPPIYLGWLKRQTPSLSIQGLFVLSAVVNSTYTFVWDVLMDWGMLQWDKERGCWRLCMREQTVIARKKTPYAVLLIFNFLLRFVWALAVFGSVPTRGHGMFFFETLEILRRTVWAVFRIEWEYVAKVLPNLPSTAAVDKESSTDKDSQADEDTALLHKSTLSDPNSPAAGALQAGQFPQHGEFSDWGGLPPSDTA